MKRLCHSCLEVREIEEGETRCASCVHNGYRRTISPENQEILSMPTIQDLKRKWERS